MLQTTKQAQSFFTNKECLMTCNHWTRCSFLALVSFVFLALAARDASAAPLIYGNFPGATVDFIGVQEESSTEPGDPGPALFGSPNVAGDSMDFDPQGFAASTNGAE